MYLVTAERQDGTWHCDPIAGDTKDEALLNAAEYWSYGFGLPAGVKAVLYNCTLVAEVDLPKLGSHK
jgi:hypothetical protein